MSILPFALLVHCGFTLAYGILSIQEIKRPFICSTITLIIFLAAAIMAILIPFLDLILLEENGSTIILASGMTVDELNKEKSNTTDIVASARQI